MTSSKASCAQQNMYFVPAASGRARGQYNTCAACRINRPVSRADVVRRASEVASAHPMLGSGFVLEDDGVYATPLDIDYKDCVEFISDWRDVKWTCEFDPETPPLFKIYLLNEMVAGEGVYLIFVMDHILVDAIAATMFMRSVVSGLPGMTKGPRLSYTPYGEYVAEEMEYLGSAEYAEDAEYWRGLLATYNKLDLPVLRSDNGDPNASDCAVWTLSEEEEQGLHRYARHRSVPPAVCYLGAVFKALAESFKAKDVAVLLAYANRPSPVSASALGITLNSLLLPAEDVGVRSLNEVVESLETELFSAMERGRFSISDAKQMAARPLPDIVVNMLPSGNADLEGFAGGYEELPLFDDKPKNAMTVYIYPKPSASIRVVASGLDDLSIIQHVLNAMKKFVRQLGAERIPL
ncbi:condensation domain-containing protein [Azospirillum argentinense]